VKFKPRSHYPRGRAAGTHWVGSWLNSRTGLDDLEETKFLTLPGPNSDHSVIQPGASRYTDYATPATEKTGKRETICINWRIKIVDI
jgi:hypothetical protein